MLRRILRRLEGERAAPPPPPPPPSTYKAVWNELGDTETRAKLHVIGSEREEDFAATAAETCEILGQTVGIRPDDTFLEIGCGVGRVGQALAPRCREWIGCDVSGNMLGHARRRLQAHTNVKFIEISGSDLKPVADQSIDVVYCTVVFMHLMEWDRYTYVLEAHRVLRPGGRVFVDNFSICTDEGWGVFENLRKIFPSEQRPQQISKSSTPQELEVYLTRAGFVDIGHRTDGQWIRCWGTKPRA